MKKISNRAISNRQSQHLNSEMSEPILCVVAGCNGSGKSSFSRSLVSADLQPFDYDFCFLQFHNRLLESDIRDTMAHNMAFAELENQINLALTNRNSFCYETNFNSTPLHWPMLFKEHGYKLHLIYLCLDSIEEAKRRVTIRVQNGGHFVPESEIIKRYFEGFANLNTHFKYFDLIDVFDTSAYSKEPRYILSLEDGVITAKSQLPEDYLIRLIPEIAKKTINKPHTG
jgi:predicted ABC-type ATPase